MSLIRLLLSSHLSCILLVLTSAYCSLFLVPLVFLVLVPFIWYYIFVIRRQNDAFTVLNSLLDAKLKC